MKESTKDFLTTYQKLNKYYRGSILWAVKLMSGLEELESARPQKQDNEPEKTTPNHEKVAKLRNYIVMEIWESGTRCELVDRLTALVVDGVVKFNDLKRAIAEARRRKDAYERTNGRDGCETVWRHLGYWAKTMTESAGREWIPTAAALEPCPYKERRAAVDEDDEDDGERMTAEEIHATLKEASRQMRIRKSA